MTLSIRSQTSRRSRTAFLALAIGSIFALAIALPAQAAQPRILMGTAQGFAVLAGAGITNTGATTLSGTAGANIGSSPTTTFVNPEGVTVTNGVKYTAADPLVDGAQSDLVTAYNDAAGRIPVTGAISADLGGQTLTPGVYNSASSIGLTGALTLDGGGDPNAVFIFQAGSTLTTASASSIVLLNGTQACNVYWQVGSSATFGTNSSFVGTVIALTDITATTGATFNGQLLARNGAVTLDTNTIVNDACQTVVEEDTTPAPSPAPIPEDSTVDGGTIPETGQSDWLIPLGIGAAVALVAALVLLRARKTD